MFLLSSCGRNCGDLLDRSSSRVHKVDVVVPAAEWAALLQDQDRSDDPSSSSDRKPARPLHRLDAAMSHYDSMSARFQALTRQPSMASGSDGTATANANSSARDSSSLHDLDDVPVPEQHVGLYQTFCASQEWSPVFASPGDFTVRLACVLQSSSSASSSLVFRLAVVCCSVLALREPALGSAYSAQHKRKSFVKFVDRTEAEVLKFVQAMALKYVGHWLVDRLPRAFSLLSPLSARHVQAYGESIHELLEYVLSMKEAGYNGLVPLTEPVSNNLVVREFFDLSLSSSNPSALNAVATTSCDARIEQRNEERPALPSAWLDRPENFFNTAGLGAIRSFSYQAQLSPRNEDLFSRTFGRMSDSGYDYKVPYGRSPSGFTRPPLPGTHHETSTCVHYVPPTKWSREKYEPGAFTVEITSIAIVDGHATYTINVLSYVHGYLEMTSIDRRYAEFEELVRKIEDKVRNLPIRDSFPPKTFFRHLSVHYLERRASYLQRFMEKLLQMCFLGILDQKIPMVAEPNIRAFLQLPKVEWSLVPRDSSVPTKTAHAHDHQCLCALVNSPPMLDRSISSPLSAIYAVVGSDTRSSRKRRDSM